jgi:hypothetical protein
MGTTSYLPRSIAFSTDAAESNETSCSPLRQPKSTQTRIFLESDMRLVSVHSNIGGTELSAHRLLYASDTLVINDNGSLYDPELMFEVGQAVQRAKLKVDTVFAMHQTPVPWEKVAALIEKATQPEKSRVTSTGS